MLIVLVRKPKPVQAPGKPALARLQKSADDHLKSGRELLAQRKYIEAKVELDQAVEQDPANAETRKLQTLASHASSDEHDAKAAEAEMNIGISTGNRKAMEDALRLLGGMTDGSPARERIVGRLAPGMVRFGTAQCGSRAWSDCAWALCEAYVIAPADARPDASVAAKLREAEKHIHDKSYARCRAVQ
jgi:hypothetical protein